MLGHDPLPGTLHQAQLAGAHQGPYSQVHTTGLSLLVATQPPGNHAQHLVMLES